VPLVAELVPIIDRWSAGKEPEAWLFAAPGGGPLRESNWKRSVVWRAASIMLTAGMQQFSTSRARALARTEPATRILTSLVTKCGQVAAYRG
jgi:hypothetical protein